MAKTQPGGESASATQEQQGGLKSRTEGVRAGEAMREVHLTCVQCGG